MWLYRGLPGKVKAARVAFIVVSVVGLALVPTVVMLTSVVLSGSLKGFNPISPRPSGKFGSENVNTPKPSPETLSPYITRKYNPVKPMKHCNNSWNPGTLQK